MGTDTLTIPLFPLPDVVFFPATMMQLHVFEPRYKELVADALSGAKLIGVPQLRPGWDKDYYGTPPIYKVLGVGEIVQSRELEEGRFDIVLAGRFRAHVLSESTQGDYRTAEVERLEDHLAPEDSTEVQWVHERLQELYLKVADALPESMQVLPLFSAEKAAPGGLIDAMASLLMDSAYDKQSMLAELDVARRQRLLRVQLRSMLRPTE